MRKWEGWVNFDIDFLSRFMVQQGIGLDNVVRIKISEIVNTLSEPQILDVGCGPGIEYASLILRSKGQFYYTGIDIADDCFVVAEARASLFGWDNYRFLHEDLFNLPTKKLRAGRFDVLIAKDVLEHLSPPRANKYNYVTAMRCFKAMQPEHLVLGFYQGLAMRNKIEFCDDGFYRNNYSTASILRVLRPEYKCEVFVLEADTVLGQRTPAVVWGKRHAA